MSNGIYIIDLQKTVKKLEEAYNFVRGLGESGQTLLFVGTKKQAARVRVRSGKALLGRFLSLLLGLGGVLALLALLDGVGAA